MIPYKDKKGITWFGPADALPKTMPHGEMLFVKTVFSILFQDINAQQNDEANDLINSIIIHKVGMVRPNFHGLNYRWCVVGAQLLLFVSCATTGLGIQRRRGPSSPSSSMPFPCTPNRFPPFSVPALTT